MSNGEHNLGALDATISTRGYFERIISDREKFDAERDLRLNERFAAQEKAIGKAEVRLDSTLQGFPQEYSRKTEMEQMRTDLANTATILAEKVVDSAGALAAAQDKVTERQDARLATLENQQAKMLGGLLIMSFLLPVITVLIVHFLR